MSRWKLMKESEEDWSLVENVQQESIDMSNKVAATSRLHCLHYATVGYLQYEPLWAKCSVKFFGYDPQTSRNTPIIMPAAMTSFVYIRDLCFDVSAEDNQTALIIIQPIWNSHFLRLQFFSSLPFFRQNVDQRYLWCGHDYTSVLKSSYRRYASNE